MRTFFLGFLPFLLFSGFFRWFYVCKISQQCDGNVVVPTEIVKTPVKEAITSDLVFNQNDFHLEGKDLEITEELVNYINRFKTGNSMLEVIILGDGRNRDVGIELGENIKLYMNEVEISRPINVIYKENLENTGNTLQIKILEY